MSDCKEKESLLHARQKAEETCAAAVVKLVRCEAGQELETKKFRLIAELAERAAMDAKDRLERHITEHRCKWNESD